MAPTFERPASFDREFQRLTPEKQREFMDAVKTFVDDLRTGQEMSRRLRIKRVQSGPPGVFELTWAPDGRATWEYGPEVRPGEPHVKWRRVGTHEVLDHP